MASLKDKIRAKNAENAINRGNTSSKETIFGDFVDREKGETTKSDVDQVNVNHDVVIDNAKYNDNSQNEETQTIVNKEPTEIIEETIKIPEVKKQTKKQSVNKTVETKPADKKKESMNKDIKAEYKFSNYSFDEKLISISLILPQELNDYLNEKAFMTDEPIRNVFVNIMVNSMNEVLDENMAKPFRKVQHFEYKRTVQIPAQLKEDLKKEAMKRRMRVTAFIAYSMQKAYDNDEEYQSVL
jgi:hypothetical protein